MSDNRPIIVNNGGGGASSVFWGLLLFFVVLPLVAMGGCMLLTGTAIIGCVGVGATAITEAEKARAEAEARARQSQPAEPVAAIVPVDSPAPAEPTPEAAPPPALKLRTWKSANDSFSVEAEFAVSFRQACKADRRVNVWTTLWVQKFGGRGMRWELSGGGRLKVAT